MSSNIDNAEFDEDCNKTEYFPFKKCNLIYDEYAAVKEHYLKDHEKESTNGILEFDNVTSHQNMLKH